jgi:cyclase
MPPWCERVARASRRQVLGGALAALGAACALPYAPRARAQQRLTVTRLGAGLVVAHGSNANVLCADTSEGVVLVDGGHESWVNELLALVEAEFPGKPIRALVNTHWHEEQTGANRALGERGVEIVAHENTAQWLGTEIWQRWSDKTYAPLPPKARPTTTFYDSTAARIADRALQYGYMRDAHTDGDINVLLPGDNVLVTGGFVSNAGWPIIDWWTGGWTVGMLNGFDRLLEVAEADMRIVPTKGPVMTLAELKSQHEMYLKVFGRIHECLIKAYGPDEVLAAKPTAEYDPKFGDPTQFVTLAFQSTWGHLRDAHDTRLRNIA